MTYKISAICLIVLLASLSSADYIVDGVGGDEISGYLLSPVFGPSKIYLTRKVRRQAYLHALPLPYAHAPVPKPPIGDSYFEIDDKEDNIF